MANQAARVAVDFQRIVDETGVTLDTAFNEFVFQLYKEILQQTPVDTGFLRASWFPSVGQPVALEVSKTDPSVSENKYVVPPTIIQRVEAAEFSAEDTVYLSNGANYGIYVEAKQNFVDRSIGAAPRLLDQAVASIKAIQGVA